jgi:hypothetical protein
MTLKYNISKTVSFEAGWSPEAVCMWLWKEKSLLLLGIETWPYSL